MSEFVDVLVIGAGLSGINAGYRLQTEHPDKRYLILERREAIGGTWDLFRYPGIRSDSDMYTLGFSFRPWTKAQSIADGGDIRNYIEDTAREFGIDRHIRFGHEVLSASWSSETATWTVEVRVRETGEVLSLRCRFMFACTGYYRYDHGYTPDFPGVSAFTAAGGVMIHPQRWPEDLDCAGKRVVVIGSGATAVTLVPALAERGAEVTMLQRSPTYILPRTSVDPLAERLPEQLPPQLAYDLLRWKNVLVGMALYNFCKRFPELARKLILEATRRQLPEGYDIDKHFSPPYSPWDERLCIAPGGDLFTAIREGRVEVVTDHIERFSEQGIVLESGRVLEADIIVTATGLELQVLGNMQLHVDGRPFDISQATTYRGVMFSGLPNMAMAFGYINASWTLKSDLIARWVCRALEALDARGADYIVPRRDDASADDPPFVELRSGYIRRAIDLLPKQGPRAPWRARQNYLLDLFEMRLAKIDDGSIEFCKRRPSVGGSDAQAAQ
ncbi:NAD(P)/FAD-dependent oxidoreductase [Pseudenhygromyxa sp. WMMC2535]|uniref:flavin-containing monooxygenase n=1 Tax=Pseudenhygromyxa sp. WMMC2535 TaxID=2712867 RepID=UPI001553E01E|nr:NAD(P)/FAD-dependent oxidoreductase [Pseudenhygromyxa sp. WMMC2535]NVB42350.1 NAD(P)/FAD-dependent oxidoreductase [Pseudenhygromyxa sp. WMMC2535]